MAVRKSWYDEEVALLKARLRRLDKRRQEGKSFATSIPVDVEVLEMLIEDWADLRKMGAPTR